MPPITWLAPSPTAIVSAPPVAAATSVLVPEVSAPLAS
jgi:hypothetical protein